MTANEYNDLKLEDMRQLVTAKFFELLHARLNILEVSLSALTDMLTETVFTKREALAIVADLLQEKASDIRRTADEYPTERLTDGGGFKNKDAPSGAAGS